MVKDRIALDLKKISKSHLVSGISKHLNTYEKRVRDIVRDFDIKSRDARVKSKEQLDKFALRVKQARGNVEHRVQEVLHLEGQRLNKGVNELLNYLKTVSNSEKLSSKASSTKKKATKAKSSVKKSAKKSASSKSRSQSSASQPSA